LKEAVNVLVVNVLEAWKKREIMKVVGINFVKMEFVIVLLAIGHVLLQENV